MSQHIKFEPLKEYSVLKRLPSNGEKCLCFGHLTYCCQEDMEKEPGWHEVLFVFHVSTYKLTDELPSDPEHTLLKEIKVREMWFCVEEDAHVIGVTKWARLPEVKKKLVQKVNELEGYYV